MTSIYIQSLTTEKIGIILENNEVKELIIDRPEVNNNVGNIYKGRVLNIEKGLQAVFIDIGQSKPGFLQKSELPCAREKKGLPIESLIVEGQEIIVQVIKEAFGDKGPLLTANITLPGVYLIYLPYSAHVAVSKKLDENTRADLRLQIEKELAEGEGAIVRTSAHDSFISSVKSELAQLKSSWLDLLKKSKSVNTPSCVFHDKTIPDRLLRQYAANGLEGIYVDDASEATSIRKRYKSLQHPVYWVKDIDGALPLSIAQIMESVVNPKVSSDEGIELYINQTEALTVIDVNSASYTGKGDKSRTTVTANLHAAKLAASQIRLRNLSGIILIDFINMKQNSHRDQVISVIKNALSEGPVRSEVHGFTKLGLLEITRKRESPNLPYILMNKAHYKQEIPFSVETNALQLEREILSYDVYRTEAIIVELHPAVYKAFLKLINLVSLQQKLNMECFIYQTEYLSSYEIKLAGSEELIRDYVNSKANSVDKLF